MPIKFLAKYFDGMSPVFIDGMLYVLIAIFQFWQLAIGSDEAAKLINIKVLFWSKFLIGTGAAALLATKLFRSTSFSDHQRKTSGDTQIWTNTSDKDKIKP